MDEVDLEPFTVQYCELLAPLFECQGDHFDFILALLRAAAHEGAGWDTLTESFQVLDDLQVLGLAELPHEHFAQPEVTRLRLSLLEYCHLVEMDAPYEILANLCRVRLGLAVSYSPFVTKTPRRKRGCKAQKSTPGEMKRLHPKQKIDALKRLTQQVGLPAIGAAFDDFYRAGVRNAIAHSDYIIFGDEFRTRGQIIPADDETNQATSTVKLPRLQELLDHARAFYLAFIRVEKGARMSIGKNHGRGFRYDERYKGILEVLVDGDEYLRGAVIHWPNGAESSYERTQHGSKPLNILPLDGCFETFVGEKHTPHDPFSPLLKPGQAPTYSPLKSTDEQLTW